MEYKGITIINNNDGEPAREISNDEMNQAIENMLKCEVALMVEKKSLDYKGNMFSCILVKQKRRGLSMCYGDDAYMLSCVFGFSDKTTRDNVFNKLTENEVAFVGRIKNI